MVDLLAKPHAHKFAGSVAVIGGGATAIDCAITARQQGAKSVEFFMLEKLSEMPLTAKERKELLDFDIELNERRRVSKIIKTGMKASGFDTIKGERPEGKPFSPANMRDLPGTEGRRTGFNAVILAIGMRATIPQQPDEGLFYAGDMLTGPKTVVQAVASGKNAALEIDAYLKGEKKPVIEKPTKSYNILLGYKLVPVPLANAFFGRAITSPLLISAY